MSTIVYLHQHFKLPSMAGSSRSYEFARRLAASGHRVHVVTGASAPSEHVTPHPNLRIHWLGTSYANHMSPRRRMWSFVVFAVRSAIRARRIGGDVVFATSTPLTIAIPALVAVACSRRRFVFEVRDLWPSVPIALGYLDNPVLKFLARMLEKVAYDRADAVIALSPGMANGVRERTTTHVTMIPNASDNDSLHVGRGAGEQWRRSHGLHEDSPLVLYAGTFGFVNNVSYMVQLAAHMLPLDPDVAFVAIGDGAERHDVAELARTLDVLDVNFFMKEAIPKSAMAAALSSATVTCSWVRDAPALWDNSANKFFDSLAASRPVVINHRGWQAELIEERQLGLVLEPTPNPEQASRLLRLLRDTELLADSASSARTTALQLFDRDALFREFEEVVTGA